MEIEVTDWRSHREALEAIRRRVFIDEQKVPEDLEWDAEDINAVHFIAQPPQKKEQKEIRTRKNQDGETARGVK